MIKYVIGDATKPQGDGNKIIIHCCNDIGGWGRGFVLALSRRWPQPEKEYRAWAKREDGTFKLGNTQFVAVEDDIQVANMIGQHGIGRDENGNPPIRYEAIRACLKRVAEETKIQATIVDGMSKRASVHAPRFGAALAGGEWSEIEKLINEELSEVDVTIYDLSK